MRSARRGICRAAIAAAVLVGVFSGPGGCASVSVRKIGADGQPTGPDGIRFYRPRVYMSVHEPFVVGARPYLATGRVTPDGRYLVIENVPEELNKRIVTVGSTAAVELSRVLAADGEGPERGGVQSGEIKPPALEKPPEAKPEPTERTGQLSLRVANDNAAFAVQPGRRYFDLMFLPDYQEDYVVSAEARMGNASADIGLGQGWSLQTMEAKVDNDAINRRLFALMDESMKILTTVARTSLGIPPVIGGGVQAGDVKTADQVFKGGTVVSIKITMVKLVAPGLYPMLKPAELAALNAATASQADPEYGQRILVPVQGNTHFAFSTYEVMVIEAAQAAGDSPLRLQQYIDVTAQGGGGSPGGPAGGAPDVAELKSVLQSFPGTADIAAAVDLTVRAEEKVIQVSPKAGQSVPPARLAEVVSALNTYLESKGSAFRAKAAP